MLCSLRSLEILVNLTWLIEPSQCSSKVDSSSKTVHKKANMFNMQFTFHIKDYTMFLNFFTQVCVSLFILGVKAVYGFMTSDWRPRTKIDKIGRPPM